MLRNLRFIVLLIFLLPMTLLAQERFVFSSDSDEFIVQVGDILLNSTNEKIQERSKEMVPQLVERWKMGRFNRKEKDAVKEIAQKLVNDRLQNDAMFFVFFRIVNNLAYSNNLHDNLSNYFVCSEKLYEQEGKVAFKNLLIFSEKFFADEVLNVKNGVKWCLRNAQYQFSEDGEFKIVVENGDLVCVAKADSSVIKNTRGAFNLLDFSWQGNGGRVSWQRFNMDDVYVKLADYFINMKNMEYSADSAVLYNKNMMSEPVIGKFSDKALVNVSINAAEFPSFVSYSDYYVRKNYFKNIYVSGLVGMKGRHFSIMGTRFDNAEMIIMQHDTIRARINSRSFLFSNGRVRSDNINFKIYFANDSVSHNGISMQYDDPLREMTLIAQQINGPYWDSYHNIDVFSEALYWNIDKDELVFNKLKTPNNESVAYFKSGNFFNRIEFDDLQMMDVINPLYLVDNYMKTYHVDEVDLVELTRFLGYEGNETLRMMMFLVRRGYFFYDDNSRIAYPKHDFYIAVNASRKKIDHDVIRVVSVTDNFSPNIVIDMNSTDLTMHGVNSVVLSQYEHNDTIERVVIQPYDNTIVVKKDLDIDFSGYMGVGRYGFYTHDSRFKYDDFLIEFPHVDSIAFTSDKGRLGNVIVNTSGIFYINESNNKSGNVYYAQYPIFDSDKESYVYFDRKSINGGKLDRNRFKFIIPDFRVEGIFALNNFQQDGVFQSGIFPDFEETLTVMEDNSLGFEHYVKDPKGVAIYDGKAVFNNMIHLSNQGFYGDGSLNFMTTFIESKQLDFYPDSVNCITRSFEMLAVNEGNLSYPYVTVDVLSMRLNMERCKMSLKTIEHPMMLYVNTDFSGRASLDSTGFFGNGRLNVEKAKVDSKYFTFKEMDLTADSSKFTVMAGFGNSESFVATNYRSAIDYITRHGSFQGIDNTSRLRFPLNKVNSNLSNVEWFIDNQMVAITGDERSWLKTTNVKTSVIDFALTQCDFDLTSFVISAYDTKVISLADVKINPPERIINIRRDTKIDTIQEVAISIVDKDYKHKFEEATVYFDEMNRYHAHGFMYYSNKHKGIEFADIHSDNKGFTTAISHVREDDGFTIGMHFNFYGDLTLTAEEKNLFFNGDFQIKTKCGTDYKWFKSKHNIKEIIISDINDLSKHSDKTLTIALNDLDHNSGVFYDPVKKRFYTSFMSEETYKNPNKKSVASIKGNVRYDRNKRSFYISKMYLNDKSCLVSVDSRINLGLTNSTVAFVADGVFNEDIDHNNVNLKLKTGSSWNFPFDKKLTEIIQKQFFRTNDTMRRKVAKEAVMFSFDEVTMRWDDSLHCFYSDKAVTVRRVMGRNVKQNTNGYLLIDYKEGTELTMYLENGNKWLYFNYKNGVLATSSSVDAYNKRMDKLNKGKRVTMKLKSLGRFEYMKANSGEKDKFLQRFKKIRK